MNKLTHASCGGIGASAVNFLSMCLIAKVLPTQTKYKQVNSVILIPQALTLPPVALFVISI